MKRAVRRSFRKIGTKVSQFRRSMPIFSRSVSSYPSYISTRSTISPPPNTFSDDDDDDDDDLFAPTSPQSPIENNRRPSLTMLPCQFCNVQQSSAQFTQHQLTCSQNPRRTLRRNRSPPRRRAVSDNVTPAPSAPPRPRSPSPTEGVQIPDELCCPITRQLFRDPVIASDGHSYERDAIMQWLRTETTSPTTRETLVPRQLICNRVVKKMVDDFRAECRKRSLFKYILGVDIQKSDPKPYFQSKTKSIYRAHWITPPPSSLHSNIVLVHFIGEHAEKVAEVYARRDVHPNIVTVFGRVQHTDAGVLLLQESPAAKTLSQLIKDESQRLTLAIRDSILSQCASALQHLIIEKILHEHITADIVQVYELDEIAGTALVKLNALESTEALINRNPPEMLSNDLVSEKSDVYFFGLLARELYSLGLGTEKADLIGRPALYERCLAEEPRERPVLNELVSYLCNLVRGEKETSESSSSE